ncbi:MAG: CpaF family protein, partial [Caulobacteraceae bacterium]
MFGKRAAGPVLQEPRPIPVAQTVPKLAPAPAPASAKPSPSPDVAAPGSAAPAATPNRAPKPSAASKMRPMASAAPAPAENSETTDQQEFYQATKAAIFNALINTIDLSQLAQLD